MSTNALSGQISINTPQIIHSNIDGEVIIVNLAAGIYYHLENIGATVWIFISGNPTFDELVQNVSQNAGANRREAEAAVSNFLSKLREEGLIVCDSVAIPNAVLSAASGVVEKATGAMFASLRVNKFTDLMKLGAYKKL
ncbi:MAG TPA: PqqD family protein [Blastocatellia bacterium]|nr:PqqD family protein [Blastocatellia bacterium]